MKFTLEKEFSYYMPWIEENVKCVIHSIELYEFEGKEGDFNESGTLIISIEDSNSFQEAEFTLWDDGTYSEPYICLPNALEEEELEDVEAAEEEETVIVHLNELIDEFELQKIFESLKNK